MSDKRTISVYDAKVDEYASMLSELPEDDILSRFINCLKKNDFVLDLGCGPASSSATMRESGLRVDPIDASLEMVKLANKTYNIDARQATFDDIDASDLYDGIWANFSLLHATREAFPGILKKLHKASKKNALFHIGMKTGEGSSRDHLDRFYTYYSEEELLAHLQHAGFLVDRVQPGTGVGLAGEVERWVSITSIAQ